MSFASTTGSYRFPEKDWSRKATIWGFAAWLAAALGLLALGFYDVYENHLFTADGVVMRGTVDRKFKTPSGRGSIPYLVYSYDVDGATYSSGVVPVARVVWLEAETREPITIRILAHDPGVSEIEAEAFSDAALRGTPLMIGILLLGGGLFHLTTGKGRSTWQRMRQGAATA